MKYKVKLLLQDSSNSDEEVLANYPYLENQQVSKGGWNSGVCFNYALNTKDIYWCETAYIHLENFYKKIRNGKIKEGDIIVYFDECNIANHFGVVYETNGTIKGTIIRSKWGSLGVYETTICKIPTHYGYCIEIWRK